MSRGGFIVLLVGLGIASTAASARANGPEQVAGAAVDDYHLVWADEFNIEGRPNPDNWTYEHGFVRNEELQWYQEDNAVCRDGLLVIEARREKKTNPRYELDADDWRRKREYIEYTSACVLTRGKQSWKHGRFVMRGKIDTRPGLWPAFWTLGSARGWPGCGEIDVMEYYRGMLLANACWLGERRRPAWDDTRHPLKNFDERWSDEYHIWQLDWDAAALKISVDGKMLNEVSLEHTVNQDRRQTQPFQEPHYLLLNLAIGGTQGGDPNSTEFPAKFEVDYVRVYQKAQPAN